MGRPPTPTSIKIRQGTLEKSRQTDNEMEVSRLANIPDVPSQIKNNVYSVEAWSSMTETLFELNMLYAADIPMIIMYCIYLGRGMKYNDFLEEHGDTFETPNKFIQTRPEVKIMNDSFDRANRLAGQFGFTPSARTKIGMPEKKKTNDFDEYVNK